MCTFVWQRTGKAPAYVVSFANPIFAQRVSLYSILVIKISMAEAGVHSVTRSSTVRTPEEQVNAMYNNNKKISKHVIMLLQVVL